MKTIFTDNWILDKRINLSNLFTAAMIAISMIWWAAQIEKRIAVLEVQLKSHYDGVQRLNSQVDKLVEHQ